jgi:hypothetical protein
MKVTLTNNYHNTQVTLRLKGVYLTAGQVKKSQNALCGIKGCTCSGVLGTRGYQTVNLGALGQEYLGGELIPSITPIDKRNVI